MGAEKVGCSVAAGFKWDGVQIVAAFLAALTDANFHTLAARVETLAKEEGLV
jgi:hypothetical protein